MNSRQGFWLILVFVAPSSEGGEKFEQFKEQKAVQESCKVMMRVKMRVIRCTTNKREKAKINKRRKVKH